MKRKLMTLGVGHQLILLGTYQKRVVPDCFVGIRTPWTLSSDTVWRKTHRTGGWLMVLGGFVIGLGAFMPHAALLPLIFVTIVCVAAIPVVQSYVLWKRERGKQDAL